MRGTPPPRTVLGANKTDLLLGLAPGRARVDGGYFSGDTTMKFFPGRTFWVENKEHGTIKAKLLLVSPNHASLLFKLEQQIAFRVDGDLAVMDILGLGKKGRTYTDILSQSSWKIYDQEPAKKLPTK
jgi:hypothetical protein